MLALFSLLVSISAVYAFLSGPLVSYCLKISGSVALQGTSLFLVQVGSAKRQLIQSASLSNANKEFDNFDEVAPVLGK